MTEFFQSLAQSITSFDQVVYQAMQALRGPQADYWMVAITELGDSAVLVPLSAAVLVWLLLLRAWRSALYWGLATGLGTLLVALIKNLFKVARPQDLYHGISSYSFPSGHATMSLIVFGFLAFLISRGLPPRRRWWPFVPAALLCLLISLSRLYLGAHWASDVIGGLLLGLLWAGVLAAAYVRQGLPRRRLAGLGEASLLVLVAIAAWHIATRHEQDLQRYQQPAVEAPTALLSPMVDVPRLLLPRRQVYRRG